ncbi:uncharacterized protein ALTATR162_LOCUS26 [Alternaria atra]|uniref:Uncharacterized protein n=1 Tax=Alternaria atra TaxID=119953 RepID=A0A8J2MZU8_9PLEO|nr:uncharacterized protein ALTATR162_LOCUS26 [Alternaria atra]CAG5136974.1 unnamed protein product [Alternaria atra]
MRTYYLVAHLFLAIHNQGTSANHVNTTGPSHSVAAAPTSDTLINTTLVNGSMGWLSFDVIQPTVPTESVIAQDNHSVLSASEFAKVELHLGGLHGSGVIELTSSPAALTTGDHASGVASPQCTPRIQSISESLSTSNQSSTTRSNNVTGLAALPTPTSLFNNTNFNISRLSTFAAPALQSLSGELAGKSRASSYCSIVAATASLCFIVFS